MTTLVNYLNTFLISGSIVTGISYLGNSINPFIAGILSGIPISIPSLLLIVNKENQKTYLFSATIMGVLLSIVIFQCYYLYVKLNYNASRAVTISMITWGIGATLYYFQFKILT